MWAQVPNLIGYDGQGKETPVRAGTYKAIDTNSQWTSINYDNRIITIYTSEITNLSSVDPKDDRPPTNGGWDLGFEWQTPKLLRKIYKWFQDLLGTTWDVAVLLFWIIIAIGILFVWRKARPTRVKVVD